MNTLLKALSIMLMMNIFAYIAINFSIAQDSSSQFNPDLKFYYKDDIINKFMKNSLDDITLNTKENWTDYNIDFENSSTIQLQKSTGQGFGSGFVAFLDSLNIVWDFFGTLWNISFSPIILLMNFRAPVFIGIIVGIPMVLIYLICIILAIRGVGD